MQYFKHSELADQYHVSLKTVHNWIGAAKDGKLDLQLHEAKSGTYVSNTAENSRVLQALAEKGKKYRNSLHHKIVRPSAEFYKIYTRRHILDIINNLNVYREIPRQYGYMDEGAFNWDNWLKRLANEDTSNLLKGTMQLLHDNLTAIDRLIEEDRKVNIIDLGVGNAFPVKELLEHLLEKGVLNRYIAIDISEAMLTIAEKNIHKWFGGKVAFEKYARDMTHERFDDLLVNDMLNEDAEKTINIVLLLGATTNNFRSFGDCFNVSYGSMSKNDLLIHTNKLDTETSRRYFDFSSEPSSNVQPGMSKLAPSHKYILDLMNIDESLYDVEAGFDEKNYMRYIRIRMKQAITLEFHFEDILRKVSLEKGDIVLLLRYWHLSAQELVSELENTGFMLLHSSLTKDRQHFLSISGVETKQTKET